MTNLLHFFRMAYKLFRWFWSGKPGAVFIVNTSEKKIADFYREPTSLEQVRAGVWASTTDAVNRGVLPVREGSDAL